MRRTCRECHSRHRKCDGKNPCHNCSRGGRSRECRYADNSEKTTAEGRALTFKSLLGYLARLQEENEALRCSLSLRGGTSQARAGDGESPQALAAGVGGRGDAVTPTVTAATVTVGADAAAPVAAPPDAAPQAAVAPPNKRARYLSFKAGSEHAAGMGVGASVGIGAVKEQALQAPASNVCSSLHGDGLTVSAAVAAATSSAGSMAGSRSLRGDGSVRAGADAASRNITSTGVGSGSGSHEPAADPRLAAWQPPSAIVPSEDEAALLRLYFTTENRVMNLVVEGEFAAVLGEARHWPHRDGSWTALADHHDAPAGAMSEAAECRCMGAGPCRSGCSRSSSSSGATSKHASSSLGSSAAGASASSAADHDDAALALTLAAGKAAQSLSHSSLADALGFRICYYAILATAARAHGDLAAATGYYNTARGFLPAAYSQPSAHLVAALVLLITFARARCVDAEEASLHSSLALQMAEMVNASMPLLFFAAFFAALNDPEQMQTWPPAAAPAGQPAHLRLAHIMAFTHCAFMGGFRGISVEQVPAFCTLCLEQEGLCLEHGVMKDHCLAIPGLGIQALLFLRVGQTALAIERGRECIALAITRPEVVRHCFSSCLAISRLIPLLLEHASSTRTTGTDRSDGAVPCSNCRLRDVECAYPSDAKRKATTKAGLTFKGLMADIARLQAENEILRGQLPTNDAEEDDHGAEKDDDDDFSAAASSASGSRSSVAAPSSAAPSAAASTAAGSDQQLSRGNGGGGGIVTSTSPSPSVSAASLAAASSAGTDRGKRPCGPGDAAADCDCDDNRAGSAGAAPPRSKRARLLAPESDASAASAGTGSVAAAVSSGSSGSSGSSSEAADAALATDPRLAAWQPPSAIFPSEDEAALLRLYFTTENLIMDVVDEARFMATLEAARHWPDPGWDSDSAGAEGEVSDAGAVAGAGAASGASSSASAATAEPLQPSPLADAFGFRVCYYAVLATAARVEEDLPTSRRYYDAARAFLPGAHGQPCNHLLSAILLLITLARAHCVDAEEASLHSSLALQMAEMLRVRSPPLFYAAFFAALNDPESMMAWPPAAAPPGQPAHLRLAQVMAFTHCAFMAGFQGMTMAQVPAFCALLTDHESLCHAVQVMEKHCLAVPGLGMQSLLYQRLGKLDLAVQRGRECLSLAIQRPVVRHCFTTCLAISRIMPLLTEHGAAVPAEGSSDSDGAHVAGAASGSSAGTGAGADSAAATSDAALVAAAKALISTQRSSKHHRAARLNDRMRVQVDAARLPALAAGAGAGGGLSALAAAGEAVAAKADSRAEAKAQARMDADADTGSVATAGGTSVTGASLAAGLTGPGAGTGTGVRGLNLLPFVQASGDAPEDAGAIGATTHPASEAHAATNDRSESRPEASVMIAIDSIGRSFLPLAKR